MFGLHQIFSTQILRLGHLVIAAGQVANIQVARKASIGLDLNWKYDDNKNKTDMKDGIFL